MHFISFLNGQIDSLGDLCRVVLFCPSHPACHWVNNVEAYEFDVEIEFVLGIVTVIHVFLLIAERDAFDALFDHAPEKLSVVKKVCVYYGLSHN